MRSCTILLACAAFAADTWTPTLSMKVQSVAEVTPSPDGRFVLWTQTRAVMDEEKSEYLTHIFVAHTDGSGRMQLTRGEKSAEAPQWSPDGKQVYFLSERSGKRNLYRIAVGGGEAERLTDWKGALGRFRLSPDGKHAAFTGREEDKDEEKHKKQKTDYKVIDASPKNMTLWWMPLDGEAPGKPKKLADVTDHIGEFDWSPDSRRIAIERVPTPSPNDSRLADIAEVEVAGGAIRPLAATSDTEANPRYSPDGRYLLYIRSKPGRLDGQRIALLNRADGQSRDLALTADEQPFLIGWSADSRRVLYAESHGTRAAIHALPLDGPPETLLATARGTISPATRGSQTHLGLVMQTPEDPAEAYVARPEENPTLVRVSAANTDAPKAPLGKTEVLRWKGKDGLEIEGLLTYPVAYEGGKRVPLALVIHGGPPGVFSEAYIAAPNLYPVAAFAAKGIAVLRPNPRGSTGYGGKFRRMVVEDWGGLDFQDLMAGVDRVIAMGIADPEKLAVMGWSYGGYMTAWTVTQTTRFRCAAVGAGITDTVSMYGTQDIPRVFEDYFGGKPWDKAAVYAKSSPMQFVARVKTPTLILHGENDARVPPGQAYEFHRALKDLGVTTRMIVYPRMPHGPNEPKFLLHIMEQHVEWAEKYLK